MAARPSDDGTHPSEFSLGQVVRDDQRGLGRVMALGGSGKKRIATVRFVSGRATTIRPGTLRATDSGWRCLMSRLPENAPRSDPIPASSRLWSRRRHVLFRIGAICLGLSPLLVLEGVCRIGGWGTPEDVGDPFVGFSDVRPLFVLDEDRYEIPASRQTYFRPDGFAATKPSAEFRIFCLGGSTVQGRPYSIETSFTTWLELSLQAADPSRRWEVVNCGGVSYASYRLVPIMQEVINYDPDLFIVYTGHNEFLEDRTYAHIKHRPAWLKAAHERLTNLRNVRCLPIALESFHPSGCPQTAAGSCQPFRRGRRVTRLPGRAGNLPHGRRMASGRHRTF